MTADPHPGKGAPKAPENAVLGVLGMVFRAIALAALALAVGAGASLLVMKNTGAQAIVGPPG